MRSIITTFMTMFMMAGNGFAIDHAPLVDEIPSPADRFFIPHGFDNNDDVEIIVQGEFSSSCYRVSRSGADVNYETKHITIWATSLKYEADLCSTVVVPFIQTVKVGMLEKGNYTVSFGTELADKISIVERSTESPDDFLYAPVVGANIAIDSGSGRQSLRLIGSYPYTFWGCLNMQDVKFSAGEGNDVLIVQPVMEHLSGDACKDHQHDFDLVYGLPQPLAGDNLLHIRTINGNSYNRFISIVE